MRHFYNVQFLNKRVKSFVIFHLLFQPAVLHGDSLEITLTVLLTQRKNARKGDNRNLKINQINRTPQYY